MPQTHKPTLAHLPGQTFDRSLPDLSRRLRSGEDPNVLLAETSDPEALKLAAYAGAGAVFQQFWEYLKEQPTAAVLGYMRRKHTFDTHQACVWKFGECVLGLLQTMRDQYVADMRSRAEGEGAYLSRDGLLLLGFLTAEARLHPNEKGVPFPSPNDLVVLLVRLVELVPRVCARDTGRLPSKHEMLAVLQHRRTKSLVREVMMNGREAVYPLFFLLEKNRQADLNSVEGVFNSAYFVVSHDEGAHLGLDSAFVDAFRACAAKFAQDKPPVHALGCPVLYVRGFAEMFDWLCEMFDAWYTTDLLP